MCAGKQERNVKTRQGKLSANPGGQPNGQQSVGHVKQVIFQPFYALQASTKIHKTSTINGWGIH
jgi:hypothetical protein